MRKFAAIGGIADMADITIGSTRSRKTQLGHRPEINRAAILIYIKATPVGDGLLLQALSFFDPLLSSSIRVFTENGS